jgi:hypothetical protein
MFGTPRSIWLIACSLYPWIASVKVRDSVTECSHLSLSGVGRRLLDVQKLRHDCYAALSIMPNTGVDVDPNETANNALKPDPEKLFNLRLTGKDTYRINGDKIRLPAVFASGDCAIEVRSEGEYSTSQKTALFQHIYTWPTLRNWAKNLIDDCLVPRTLNQRPIYIDWMWRFFDWVWIGTSRGNYENLKLETVLLVKGNEGESNIPQFSEMDKEHYRVIGFNVYTPTGQIHDTRWKIPWQRPP